MHTKVCMRVEKLLMTLTQVWNVHCGTKREHCSPKGSTAHLLYGLPRWYAEEGEAFNG